MAKREFRESDVVYIRPIVTELGIKDFIGIVCGKPIGANWSNMPFLNIELNDGYYWPLHKDELYYLGRI